MPLACLLSPFGSWLITLPGFDLVVERLLHLPQLETGSFDGGCGLIHRLAYHAGNGDLVFVVPAARHEGERDAAYHGKSRDDADDDGDGLLVVLLPAGVVRVVGALRRGGGCGADAAPSRA